MKNFTLDKRTSRTIVNHGSIHEISNRIPDVYRARADGFSAMDDIRDFRMTVSGVKKMDQIRATGAKYVAAACSNCKRQLTQLMEHYEEDIAVGGVHDMLSRAILINGKAAERVDYE